MLSCTILSCKKFPVLPQKNNLHVDMLIAGSSHYNAKLGIWTKQESSAVSNCYFIKYSLRIDCHNAEKSYPWAWSIWQQPAQHQALQQKRVKTKIFADLSSRYEKIMHIIPSLLLEAVLHLWPIWSPFLSPASLSDRIWANLDSTLRTARNHIINTHSKIMQNIEGNNWFALTM